MDEAKTFDDRFYPLVLGGVAVDECHREADIEVGRADMWVHAGIKYGDQQTGDETSDEDSMLGRESEGTNDVGRFGEDHLRDSWVIRQCVRSVSGAQGRPP